MPSFEPTVTTLRDGVEYRFNDNEAETTVKITGKARTASIRVSVDGASLPPFSGNLDSPDFRGKLCANVSERLANVNGFSALLDAVATRYPDDFHQRDEDAKKHDSETNTPALAGTPYCIIRGGLARVKQTSQGEFPQQLTNFVAHVEEDTITDDGAEQRRIYRIIGNAPDGPLPPVEVPAAKFSPMRWVGEKWGLRAQLEAGQSVADFARRAIELLSQDARRRYIYKHTGFRDLGNETVFLHAAGAVGEHPEGVEVDLEQNLNRYSLPTTSSRTSWVEGIHTALLFLQCAPARVTYPLLGMAAAAPLSEMVEPDFTLWVHGKTGSFKSTLSALPLSMYGNFTEDQLPMSFESTANFQERMLFVLKDCLSVVDDWRPAVGRADAAEMDKKAQRLLRSVGNRSGRGRMNPDGSLKHAYDPRGAVIATAESVPEGPAFASAAQRALTVALKADDVDIPFMTEVQADREKLPHATVGYIRWLLKHRERLASELPQQIANLRDELRLEGTLEGAHPRVPKCAAHLICSLKLFFTYAQEAGAITEARREEYGQAAREAILEAAQAHVEATKEDDPAARFVTLLRSLIDQDRAYLKDRADDRAPAGYINVGWEASDEGQSPKRGAEFIGWVDDGFVYLDRDASYNAVTKFATRGEIGFGTKQKALWRALKEAGISRPDKGRNDTLIRVGKDPGRRTRVIQIPRRVLSLDQVEEGVD